jgi:hypothetical protein
MSQEGRRVKLKYPCKIGNQIYDRGTEVTPVPFSDARVQNTLPGIGLNVKSNQIAVMFPARSTPTIIDISQVERG